MAGHAWGLVMELPSTLPFMKRTMMPSESNWVVISAARLRMSFRSSMRSPPSSKAMDPARRRIHPGAR